MCNYLSKQDDECSQAMKQAFKETLERGSGSCEYVSKRECSLQEAV